MHSYSSNLKEKIHYDFSTLDYYKSDINIKERARKKWEICLKPKLQIFILICRINHGEGVDFMNGGQNTRFFNSEHFVLAWETWHNCFLICSGTRHNWLDWKKYSKLEEQNENYFRRAAAAFNSSLTRQHLTCYLGIIISLPRTNGPRRSFLL